VRLQRKTVPGGHPCGRAGEAGVVGREVALGRGLSYHRTLRSARMSVYNIVAVLLRQCQKEVPHPPAPASANGCGTNSSSVEFAT